MLIRILSSVTNIADERVINRLNKLFCHLLMSY